MTQLEILNYAIIGVVDLITDWTEEAINSEDEAQKKRCDMFVKLYKADLEKLQEMEEEIRQVYEDEGMPYPRI